MKFNIYPKFLKFLSIIGFIPTSTFQLIIVGILDVLILSLGTFAYYWSYFVIQNFKSDNVITIITDISFLFLGTMCPFLNYMLQKSFPNMLHDPTINGNTFFQKLCLNFLQQYTIGTYLSRKIYLFLMFLLLQHTKNQCKLNL